MKQVLQMPALSRSLYLRGIFFVIFLLVYSTLLSGQDSFLPIELSYFNSATHYTTENGLASNSVYDIEEDRYGYLWIATGNGIARFDGSHFTNYEYYTENGILNEMGFVSKLFLNESRDTLWIGGAKGLFYTSIEKFELKKIDSDLTSMHFPTGRTDDFLIYDHQIIWATSFYNGLSKIDIKQKTSENFSFINTSQKDNAKLNSLRTIAKDPLDSNILWLGTGAGLIRFDVVSKDYEVYAFGNDPELNKNHIRNIYVTDNDVYWGTWSAGVIRFNKQSEQFHQPFKEDYPNSHELILDMYKDSKQVLWISTRDGLIEFDVLSKSIKKVTAHNLAKGIMRGVSFIDSRGIIWFCDGKGLFKYDPLQSQDTFIALEERSSLESPMLVREIIPANGFFYVLGQYSSGLHKINPVDNTFETIDLPLLTYSDEVGYNLKDMVAMEDGNFLVLSEKIIIYNPITQKSSLSPLQIDHPNPSMQSVVKDKSGNFWVGTRNGGLFCLNFEKGSVLNYKDGFNVFREGNHGWINRLYLDKEDKLWIAKGSTTVMDIAKTSIHVLNRTDSVKWYQDVGGFQEDSKGRIWMAGYDKGMGFTNFKDFKKGITQQTGGYFSGVYVYTDSLLWTTGKGQLGIIDINTASHKIIRLNSSNNSLYVSGPIVGIQGGQYIIGCDNGVVIHDSAKKEVYSEAAIPYIRKITANGKTGYEGASLENKNLIFESGTNHMVLNISALGFHKPEQTTYSYKLQDEWIDLGISQEINVTNLGQGSYTFKIKACNGLGVCNEAPTEYNFTILAPWYKSWWAYIFYAILIWTVGSLLYKFNLSRNIAVAEKQKTMEFDEAKSTMYANISHEFRTPLTIINGLSKFLLDKNSEDREQLNGILLSGKQLLNLVNQMLDLVSLDANKLEVSYKSSDVIDFIQKSVNLYSSYADSKQQQLIFRSDTASLIMDFDDDKLQKVLNNILSNAIKFSPKNGSIHIDVQKNNNILIVKIIDSGDGIAPEHLPHVFERYYKTFDLDNNIGSGIGMALTKELVELLKGSISVDSKLGDGSIFTIELPIQNTVTLETEVVHQIPFIDNIGHHEDEDELMQDIKAAHSLLIVEDNKEIRNFIKLLLGNLYNVHTAKNGVEGLKIAKNKKIDFIISDVMMPKMDGYEFCKHIKNDIRTSHIPFIIISARTASKDRLEAYKLGIDAYLHKPFNEEELMLIIKNLLEKKQEQARYFSKLLGLKQDFKEVPDINQLDLDLIRNLQELILDNKIKLSTDQLAKKLLTSRTQLHRKVKALTGMSITNYINHLRIEKSKGLLKETSLHISEIAYQIGFESSTYFSRIFKKEQGITPADYREKHP